MLSDLGKNGVAIWLWQRWIDGIGSSESSFRVEKGAQYSGVIATETDCCRRCHLYMIAMLSVAYLQFGDFLLASRTGLLFYHYQETEVCVEVRYAYSRSYLAKVQMQKDTGFDQVRLWSHHDWNAWFLKRSDRNM